MKKSYLYKYEKLNHETVVFVGNGATEYKGEGQNAWEVLDPLFQKLSSVVSDDLFEHRRKNRELYSSLLGIYSVKFKRARQSLYFNLCQGKTFREWKAEYKIYFDIISGYINVRKEIGKLFDTALNSNHLTLRYSDDF